MGLKEKFIMYCELQRSARDIRERRGTDDPITVEAYVKANTTKREVLDMIEKLENE